MQQVRVTDIPDRVQLIGRLGHPLGELINISGKWVGPTGVAKDASLHFRVFKVNGKQLKVPVDFFDWAVTPIDSKPPQPKEGDTWDLRGVEIGGFREVPNQLRRERYGLKGEGDSPVQQQYGFEFITEFVYLPPAEDEQK